MGLRLQELIAESLGLEKDHIKKALGEQGQHMAVNYYPPYREPEPTYGLPGHTDPNAFTILLQDLEVAGLQVLKDGKWMAVKPYPNAFVIDIGDQLQINDFKNREFRLPHPSSWPPHNIPKGKRANQRMRTSFANAVLEVEEESQMQDELNNSKNLEKRIFIRSKILENLSESKMEVVAVLLKLSEQMPNRDATNEDKAMDSCLLDFSKQRARSKRPYSTIRDEENGDRDKKKMKIKKEKTLVLRGPDLSPELPINFRERIKAKEGSGVVLVIQQNIFNSNINDGLNHLSIPESRVESEFLSAEENALLLLKDEKCKNKRIEVVMIGPQDEYIINLVKWEMKKGKGKKSSWTYNLVTTWNKVVKENNLQPEMIVQLWSYRVDSKLNFALVIVRGESN